MGETKQDPAKGRDLGGPVFNLQGLGQNPVPQNSPETTRTGTDAISARTLLCSGEIGGRNPHRQRDMKVTGKGGQPQQSEEPVDALLAKGNILKKARMTRLNRIQSVTAHTGE